MRLIVTTVTVVLIAAAVIGVGWISERNVRRVLTRELETRVVLESRNLAALSVSALLDEFPELVLHPVLRDMERERPDLALIFVVDHEGVVQGHADADQLGSNFNLDIGLQPVHPSVRLDAGETLSGNDEYVVISTPIRHSSGEVIGRAVVGLDRSHIDKLLADARRTQAILLLAVMGAAILLTPILISILLKPIGALRGGLERIGRGDLDFRLNISTMTEFGALSRSVNDMATRLKSAQLDLVEKERLDHEMQLARQIQRSLLPSESTRAANFFIAGAQRAADEVGGDYYDVFPLEDGRIGMVIADVAGKGLGGCMVTSMIAVLIRTLCPKRTSPTDLLVALHESLYGSLQPGTFITMFYGMLDPRSGRLTYASAGHNPVLHYMAANRDVRWHRSNGIPLGLMPGAVLQETLEDQAIDINSGDIVVQYTDGFHEAMNENGEEFGFDRMERLTRSFAVDGCERFMTRLQETVEDWERPLPASDDKTLLVVECDGSPVKELGEPNLGPTSVQRKLMRDLWQRRGTRKHYFTAPAKLDALDRVGVWLRGCDFIKELSAEEQDRLEHGIYEIACNIAEHGCQLDAEKFIDFWWIPGEDDNEVLETRRVDLETAIDRVNRGYFLIRDHGEPPEADKWSMSDLRSKKVQEEGRGLGLRIIYRTFEEVEFHANTEMGNVTVMKFKVKEAQKT